MLFRKRNKPAKSQSPESQPKRPILDVKLSQFSRNVAMSSEVINATYRPVFLRAKNILDSAGLSSHFLPVMDALCEMISERRGMTLPVGVLPEKVQRYREITSFSMTVAMLAKTLAVDLSGTAIEIDSHGEQLFVHPMFNYLLSSDQKIIGPTKAHHAVIGKGAELALTQWHAFDLLMASPSGLNWYASFPDMLALLMSSLADKENSLFGMTINSHSINAITKITALNNQQASSTQPNFKSTPSVPKPISNTNDEEKGTSYSPLLDGNKSKPRSQNEAMQSVLSLVGKGTGATAAPPTTPPASSSSSEFNSQSQNSEKGVKEENIKPSSNDMVVPELKTNAPISNESGPSTQQAINSLESLINNATLSRGAGLPDDDSVGEEAKVYLRTMLEMFGAELSLGEHCGSLGNEEIYVIPTRWNRQVIQTMYRSLPKQNKNDAEHELNIQLRQLVVGQEEDERLNFVDLGGGRSGIPFKRKVLDELQ